MNNVSWIRAAISGVIGLLIGLVLTYVVSLLIPTTNLRWSLMAVGFASFFAAVSGFVAGASRKS